MERTNIHQDVDDDDDDIRGDYVLNWGQAPVPDCADVGLGCCTHQLPVDYTGHR